MAANLRGQSAADKATTHEFTLQYYLYDDNRLLLFNRLVISS